MLNPKKKKKKSNKKMASFFNAFVGATGEAVSQVAKKLSPRVNTDADDTSKETELKDYQAWHFKPMSGKERNIWCWFVAVVCGFVNLILSFFRILIMHPFQDQVNKVKTESVVSSGSDPVLVDKDDDKKKD